MLGPLIFKLLYGLSNAVGLAELSSNGPSGHCSVAFLLAGNRSMNERNEKQAVPG